MSEMWGIIVKIGGIVVSRYLLGVDSGGTVTKAVLYDLAGREIAAGAAGSRASTPQPRWVERDMSQAWTACAEAIRQAISGIDPADIAGIGMTGHNDGIYLVDSELRPVRPAILASDTRAEPILDEWRAAGIEDAALALIGQWPFAASPVAVLSWLARNEPSTVDRARWLLFCKDWLRLRLTGEVAT